MINRSNFFISEGGNLGILLAKITYFEYYSYDEYNEYSTLKFYLDNQPNLFVIYGQEADAVQKWLKTQYSK